MAVAESTIRSGRDLYVALNDFCEAASRQPGDVLRDCLRMLLQDGHASAEARLTAALHGHQEWPDPMADS